MSTLTQQRQGSQAPGEPDGADGAAGAAGSTRRLFSRTLFSRRGLALLVAVVVLGWSIVELVSLTFRHTIGPELYGVLVAALAVAAGALDVALLKSSTRRFWVSIGVLILWAVVALGGLAGVVAHVVGPVPGHGPVDLRPRPIAAPLIFTLLGVIGGAALFFGQRLGAYRVPEPGKE